MGMRRVLHKRDNWVSTPTTISIQANTPAIIARAEPDKKMVFRVSEFPALFLELKDTSGNKLPGDTKIILAGIDQSHDLPYQLTPSHILKPWNDIEYAMQKNAKYIHNFVIDLRAPVLVEEKEQLLIVVISSADVTLDWNQSEFELAVEELTMEEVIEAGLAGSDFFYGEYEPYE